MKEVNKNSKTEDIFSHRKLFIDNERWKEHSFFYKKLEKGYQPKSLR